MNGFEKDLEEFVTRRDSSATPQNDKEKLQDDNTLSKRVVALSAAPPPCIWACWPAALAMAMKCWCRASPSAHRRTRSPI